MSDVLQHPWVTKDDCATLEEIHKDFENRKNLIDLENEAKRQQKEIARQQQAHASATGTARRQYRTVGVPHSDDTTVQEIKHELRVLDKYIPGVATNTQFFSTMSPQELLGEINGVINDRKGKTVIDPKKYKLKAQLKYVAEVDEDEKMEDDGEEEQQDEDEQEPEDLSNMVEFQVKIRQVGDQNKYSVEFSNINGDKLVFY